MDIREFIKKKSVLSALIAITALFCLLAIFEAGVFVGFHKARFSERMGNNYFYRTFGAPQGGMHGGVFEEELPNAYGAAGKIVSVSLPTFIVDDRGVEKVIVIRGDTQIKRFHDTATSSDIAADDFAVIIGQPDEKAQIQAKLIRLLPPPQDDTQ